MLAIPVLSLKYLFRDCWTSIGPVYFTVHKNGLCHQWLTAEVPTCLLLYWNIKLDAIWWKPSHNFHTQYRAKQQPCKQAGMPTWAIYFVKLELAVPVRLKMMGYALCCVTNCSISQTKCLGKLFHSVKRRDKKWQQNLGASYKLRRYLLQSKQIVQQTKQNVNIVSYWQRKIQKVAAEPRRIL